MRSGTWSRSQKTASQRSDCRRADRCDASRSTVPVWKSAACLLYLVFDYILTSDLRPRTSDFGCPAMSNPAANSPWYSGITGYQWPVLTIASLGWIFDVFEGQVFVASMNEAMPAILPTGTDDAT